MNRESVIAKIKAEISCKEYLDPSQSGQYVCPICGSGTGRNKTGALHYYEDTNTCYCFSCKQRFDVIDLERSRSKTDFNTAVEELAGRLGETVDRYEPLNADLRRETAVKDKNPITTEKTAQNETESLADYKDYYTACRERITEPAAAEYLKARGISQATAAAYGIGFDPAADPINNPGGTGESKRPAARLIIPTTRSHYAARAVDPNENTRYLNPNMKKGAGSPGIFNAGALYSADTVFVCEGAIDALSIIEAGAPAVGLNSTSNAKKLIAMLEEKRPTAAIIISPDNDDPGRKAAGEIRAALERLHIGCSVAPEISGKYKDANEHLTKDRGEFLAAVQAAAHKPETGEQALTDFFKIIKTEKYKPIPTGIDELDRRLYGGLISQWLVMLTAAPGAGKTALATQIIENIAKAGRQCLYINLEMSREQLIARSLARIIADHGEPQLSAVEILRYYARNNDEKKRIETAGEYYQTRYAANMLYNPDNTGADLNSIMETLERRADAARSKGKPAPIVCIDYLQMIRGDARDDTAAVIKRAVEAFKSYAVRNDSIVICISAQSRAANNGDAARMDAGRDTSNIEYGADLQIQLLTPKDREDARQLFVTKARFAQPSLTQHIDFIFDGKAGRLKSYSEIQQDVAQKRKRL